MVPGGVGVVGVVGGGGMVPLHPCTPVPLPPAGALAGPLYRCSWRCSWRVTGAPGGVPSWCPSVGVPSNSKLVHLASDSTAIGKLGSAQLDLMAVCIYPDVRQGYKLTLLMILNWPLGLG